MYSRLSFSTDLLVKTQGLYDLMAYKENNKPGFLRKIDYKKAFDLINNLIFREDVAKVTLSPPYYVSLVLKTDLKYLK